MGLFDRYHLSAAAAEGRLKRPITGDPSQGERSVLVALNKDRIEDARRQLREDRAIKPDFREFVDEHLRSAGERARANKLWNVRLPPELFDHYAGQARAGRLSISECLEDALRRDHEQAQEARNLVQALEENVRGYMAAARQVLTETQDVAKRLGALQDLSMRLTRMEGALQNLANMPARR